jgi:hypothetical protein
MRRATLIRQTTGDAGTFGLLTTDTGVFFATGELPWRKNASDLSCIPVGTYVCHFGISHRLGLCYYVNNVPGRTGIMIHAGNYCGDTEKGLASDVEGCILLGQHFGEIAGQRAVCLSVSAVRQFVLEMKREPFELVVQEKYA